MIKDSGRELNMRNPEQDRNPNTSLENKGVHSFATVGRTATGTPTIEAPPEVKRRPEKRYIQPGRKALYARLVGTLAALAATAGPAVNHQINDETQVNLPAITRDISSIPGFYWNLGKSAVKDIQGLFNKEIPVPTTFDINASKSSIEAGVNAVVVSKTELKKAYEEQSAQNTDGRPTVVFPVKFTASGQRIDYEYQERFLAGTDSQTGKPVYMERPGTIIAHFSVGEEIAIPAENAEVFQFPPQIIGGKEYFVGLWIKFQQNGETYAFGISGQDVRTFIPLGEAASAPLVPTNEGGTLLFSEAKNGLKLPLGTPVARVNINPILNSGFSFSRYNPNNPHVNARWESIKPNFVTDNSMEQTKLLIFSTNQ